MARNADALLNLLNWARTGVETPMYVSPPSVPVNCARTCSGPTADSPGNSPHCPTRAGLLGVPGTANTLLVTGDLPSLAAYATGRPVPGSLRTTDRGSIRTETARVAVNPKENEAGRGRWLLSG